MAVSGKEGKMQSRAQNWTDDEIKALVDSISMVYDRLFGPFSTNVTNDEKKAMWIHIQTQVNSVSTANRQLDKVQLKWTDLKSRVKEKASSFINNMKKTGGGEMPDMTWTAMEETLAGLLSTYDQKIVSLLGPTAIVGISGGIDTSKPRRCVRKKGVELNSSFSSVSSPDPSCEEGCEGNGQSETRRDKEENTHKRQKVSDASEELLNVQRELAVNTGRIANCMEEMLWILKLKCNLDPNQHTSAYVVTFNETPQNDS